MNNIQGQMMTVREMRAALPAVRGCVAWVNVTANDGDNFKVSKAEIAAWLRGRDGNEVTRTIIDNGLMFIG